MKYLILRLLNYAVKLNIVLVSRKRDLYIIYKVQNYYLERKWFQIKFAKVLYHDVSKISELRLVLYVLHTNYTPSNLAQYCTFYNSSNIFRFLQHSPSYCKYSRIVTEKLQFF